MAQIAVLAKTGSLVNLEYCSGSLRPKVVLGEMGGLGQPRLIKAQVQVLGGNSGRSGAAPGGH